MENQITKPMYDLIKADDMLELSNQLAKLILNFQLMKMKSKRKYLN